jgi:glycerol uptake facilitator-like aquaporin
MTSRTATNTTDVNFSYVPNKKLMGDRMDSRNSSGTTEKAPFISTGEGQQPESGSNTNPLTGDGAPMAYSESWRFRVPVLKWRQQIAFCCAEVMATLLFCTFVLIAQGDFNIRTGRFTLTPTTASLTDYYYLSIVIGTAAFASTFLFWNYGRPQFNPAVTILFWAIGHTQFLTMFIRIFLQMSTALLAYTLAYGFVYPIDPTPGPGLVNLAGHSDTYYFLWEFLGTTFLSWFTVWVLTSDRLFKEGVTVAQGARGTISNKAKVSSGGEGTHTDNSAPLKVSGIPSEYQQSSFGGMLAFQAAVVTGVGYFLFFYIGLVATGGTTVLNFLLWFPRVLNQNGLNSVMYMTLPIQGGIYFGTPALGGLITCIVSIALVGITRKFGFGTMEEESVPYGDYPMST